MKGSEGSSVNSGEKSSFNRKSSRSGKKGSRGTQTPPAAGARCVKSSGSSFTTAKKGELSLIINFFEVCMQIKNMKIKKN